MIDAPMRIVLVDDDPDDIEVALRAVRREQLPVEITVFQDGREVLDALGSNGSGGEMARLRPRAIFLDLRMPRIDGWEILRRLRADPQTKDIPVIVQSWSSERDDIARSYALGANSFVAKRLTPGSPGFYFTDAVRYWIQLNQIPSSVGAGA
jgi:two-component system response regulator